MKLIFPSMEYLRAGGTENVVVEIAREATRTAAAEIVIMGSANAFVVRRLQEHSVPFELVRDTDLAHFRSQPEDLFVHFSNHDWLARIAHLPGRAVVWCLLAHLMTGWNRFNFEQRLMGRKRLGAWLNRRLIQSLKDRNALLAMDGATAEAIDDVAGGADTPLLPIPIDASRAGVVEASLGCRSEPVVVTYIGRSDDVWKIYPARKLLRDLSALPFRSELEIFTDDNKPFESMLADLTLGNVQVRYSLGVFGSALRDRIGKRSTLHVSMGMSVLEGALSGAPAALIDPSYSDHPDCYRYKWLWESPEFSLGRFVQPSESDFQGHTLEALIARSTNSADRAEVIRHCVDYVVEHHSPERILRALLASQTSATNRDLVRWTPAALPMIQSLGSVLFRHSRGTKS